jgi:hypothetical protein
LSDYCPTTGYFRIPLIEVPLFDRSPVSRRCVARRKRLLNAIIVANQIISSLNSLASSTYGSSFSSESLRFSQPSTDADQWRALNSSQMKRIQGRIFNAAYELLRRFRHLGEAQRAELESSMFAELTKSQSSYLGSSSPPQFVDTSRISVPDTAGQIDVVASMSPDFQLLYSSPNDKLLVSPEPSPDSLPRACFMVSKRQYPLLVARLLRARIVNMISDPKVINGLFAVLKSDGMQRLIADMRPGGAFFKRPPPIELPSADLIAELIPESQDLAARPLLQVGKRDISDFFFRFAAPGWMIPFQALPAIKVADLNLTAEELSRFGLRPEQVLYPAFRVCAMGMNHSPAMTQNAHLNIIYRNTSLRPCDALTRFNDRRLDRLRHMVCLDDVVYIAPARLKLVQPALLEYDYMAEAQLLLVKREKDVDATSSPVDCLGAEVDGQNGLVRISPKRLLKLRAATQWVLLVGKATGEQIASLVGSWAWVMLLFRPSLSIFRRVYKFAACAGTRRFTLWHSVRGELTTACNLSPLFQSDLRAHFWSRAIASDASESAMGVVSAPISRASSVNLASVSMHQHALLRLQQSPSFSLQHHQLQLELSRQAAQFITTSHWTTLISYPWNTPEHINSLEFRALLAAIRWAASHPSGFNARVTAFTDSQVVFFAASKGRSSSRALYHRMRSLAAYLLAFGIRLRLTWIPSELNPADAPSRFIAPGGPYPHPSNLDPLPF